MMPEVVALEALDVEQDNDLEWLLEDPLNDGEISLGAPLYSTISINCIT